MKTELSTKEFLNKLINEIEKELDKKNSWGKNEAKAAVKMVIMQAIFDMLN